MIKRVRRPTLVVGAEASIFSAESQRWIAAQIPGAEVEIFKAGEGGSHFMCYENPSKFNALVESLPILRQGLCPPRSIPLARHPAYGGGLGTGCPAMKPIIAPM